MTSGAVQLSGGKVLKDAGKVSTGEDCCCGGCCNNKVSPRTCPCLTKAPDQLLIALSGFAYGGVLCPGSNCSWADGTFVLDKDPYYSDPSNPLLLSEYCSWRYVKGQVCGQFNRGIFATITDSYDPVLYPYAVTVTVLNFFLSVIFRFDYGAPFDCKAIKNLNLPLVSNLGILGGCRAISPTAVLTAL